MKIKDTFDKPKVICVVGDVNEAKSNLLYHLLDELNVYGTFKLYTYGLRADIDGATGVFSVDEIEQIKNSIIILDEVMSLWDLDNRMAKKQIEKTLRLIHHNNNILVICGLPENLKKFISGKINQYFFKQCTLADFIMGSKASRVCTNYKGVELGSNILTIRKNQALYFDGKHYDMIDVPYLKDFDSKKENIEIVKQNVNQSVNEKVNQSVNDDAKRWKLPINTKERWYSG